MRITCLSIYRDAKPIHSRIGYLNGNISNQINIENLLTNQEQERLSSFRNKYRYNEYLLSRYLAKNVLSEHLDEPNFQNFEISSGIFGQPIVYCESRKAIGISYSHSGATHAAISFPLEHPMAIDCEYIDNNSKVTIRNALTPKELIVAQEYDDRILFQMWTIKESLTKILRCGITSPLAIFEFNNITINQDSSFEASFVNFMQYKGFSLCNEKMAIGVVLPKKSKVDIQQLQSSLNHY